jgi:hypothetical protein
VANLIVADPDGSQPPLPLPRLQHPPRLAAQGGVGGGAGIPFGCPRPMDQHEVQVRCSQLAQGVLAGLGSLGGALLIR